MKKELKKIVLVEDEDDIRMVCQIALEQFGGFQILPCSGADEFWKTAENFQPDLILLDVMMPRKDGPTLLGEIQTHPFFEKTPVAFLTAKVQSNEIQELTDLGAIGVLQKPFDPMKISGQLLELWKCV